MSYTNDPVADFDAWDTEQNKRLEQLPVCCYCTEHIQQDHYFLINDEVICPDCMDSYFRKEVDDLYD